MATQKIRSQFGQLLSNTVLWTARFLAVAAVAMLGKSSDSLAAKASFENEVSYTIKAQVGDEEMSYVQVGDLDEDGEDPPMSG